MYGSNDKISASLLFQDPLAGKKGEL